MNSEQEKIVSELSQRSLGASFLFVPREYRNGKATFKPCDVVWVCNGCIILISMVESVRSREKMSRHNFNQIKSWYREWQGGRNLVGRNAYTSFSIPFDQYEHKVLLSVVKGADAVSEWNGEVAEQLAAQGSPPPTLCATITQNVLEYLAAQGGSGTDLLLFLAGLREPLTAEASLKGIRRQHNVCFNVVPPGETGVDFRDDPRLYALDPVYNTLRSAVDSLIPYLLSDLSWDQLLRVVVQIKQLERKTSSLPPGMFGTRAASALLDFPPYLFGVIVCRFRGQAGSGCADEHFSLLQQNILHHPKCREQFCVIVSCNIDEQNQRSVSALVIPTTDETAPTLRSQTAALLDKLRDLQATR